MEAGEKEEHTIRMHWFLAAQSSAQHLNGPV